MSGILVAIDFEKAFDSLDHTYLLKVVHAFNFGPSFIQWIRTFYSNISSCIINNGFTSDYFAVGSQMKPIFCLMSLIWTFFLENLTLTKINHIILLAKYFIYKCKFSKASPSLTVFKAKLKATYKLELYTAKKNGILINHYKKWDHLLSWLS